MTRAVRSASRTAVRSAPAAGPTPVGSTSLGSPARRPFAVMAKPVGSRCNLRCSYCYYLQTPHAGGPRLPDDLLEEYVRQYIAANPGPAINFVWHGGEPTLAGLDFYRRAVAFQHRYLPAGWSCWNNLQTNGILLDDDWCSFLADNHFDVGVSIDGTAEIHDFYRPDLRGAGSYQGAAEAIRRLQAHGIQPDLLCTVTSTTAHDPLGVYRNLRGFASGWIQFIPIVRRDESGELTADSVDATAWGEFLCTVFDDWVSHDLETTTVQFFAETMKLLAGGTAGVCWLAPTCGQVLVLEADGSVYSCDHFVNQAHRLGDIRTSTLAELANSPAQRQFGDHKLLALPQQCRECPWLGLCHGSCPKDRVDAGPSVLCAGLARFYAHATPVMRQVIDLTRAGLTPTAVMARLADAPDTK